MTTPNPDQKDLQLAKQKPLLKGAAILLKATMGLSAAFSGLMVAGGLMVASSASLPLVALAGATAATLGAYRVYSAVRNIVKSEQLVASFFKKIDDVKNAPNAPKSRVDFVNNFIQDLDFGVPQWMQKPIVQLGMTSLTLGVGVALWPVGGFLATTASLWMMASGGLGVLGAGSKTLKDGPLGTPACAKITITYSSDKNAPAPASKLNDLAAKADFKTAANTNQPAATAEQPAPAADVKPPKIG